VSAPCYENKKAKHFVVCHNQLEEFGLPELPENLPSELPMLFFQHLLYVMLSAKNNTQFSLLMIKL
jgi:hypothetical protein